MPAKLGDGNGVTVLLVVWLAFGKFIYCASAAASLFAFGSSFLVSLARLVGNELEWEGNDGEKSGSIEREENN